MASRCATCARVTRGRGHVFVNFFYSMVVSFPRVTVLYRGFVGVLYSPIVLFFRFSLSRSVVVPPTIGTMRVFSLHPILKGPIPKGSLFPVGVQSSSLCIRFSRPLTFYDYSSIFLRYTKYNVLYSSGQEGVGVPSVGDYSLFEGGFHFLPTLFNRKVCYMVQISVSCGGWFRLLMSSVSWPKFPLCSCFFDYRFLVTSTTKVGPSPQFLRKTRPTTPSTRGLPFSVPRDSPR